MSIITNSIVNKKKNFYEWKVPKVSWGIFTIVSAVTTSLGMSETFFDGDSFTGFAVALGIQLLLLWMNKKIARMYSKIQKRHIRCLLIGVYSVTVFWSTGFSFVYISNHVYSSVFMRDDQAQLEQVYQKNMIVLRNTAEKDFSYVMEEIVAEVNELQSSFNLSAEVLNDASLQNCDFSALEKYFENDMEMLQNISQVNKLASGEPVGNADKIMMDLEEYGRSVGGEADRIKADIKGIENDIEFVKKNIMNYSEKKYYVRSGTTADNTYQKLIDEEEQRKTGLEQKQKEKEILLKEQETILREIKTLKSYISVYEGSLENTVSSNFAQILALLVQKDPDIESAHRQADNIFAALSEKMQEQGDNTVYTNQMQKFLKFKQHLGELSDIRRVQEYFSDSSRSIKIKDIEKMVCSYPSVEVKENWRNLWNQVYIELKANFLLLPSSEEKNIQKAVSTISWFQRSLLTDLNGIERAVYYLICPHSLLAWLSLLLALFLDTCPIVFMVVQSTLEKSEKESEILHLSAV